MQSFTFMKEESESPDFEYALSRLETLVKQLEQGDLKLEEALTTFEEGVKLTKFCQQALKTAEQKVNTLVEEQGKVSSEPFAKDAIE